MLLAVLLFVLISSLAASGMVQSYQTFTQREKEEQLLFVGEQFQKAIASYTHTLVGPVSRPPPSLEALLNDNRFPTAKQHLRRMYIDPMTGKADWVVVMGLNGVMGVHSRSTGEPLKVTGFAERFKAFEGKTSYAQWVFAGPN